MTLAFNTRHPHVYPNNRWIASLSDGTTVFEDITPGMKTAWMRLKEYVAANDLHITNLRLEYAGQQARLIPYKDEAGNPQLLGYWQAKKQKRFITSGVSIEKTWRGIGYLSGNKICITWITEEGGFVPEVRDYDPKKEGVILNG
jgi:hypothetical protein